MSEQEKLFCRSSPGWIATWWVTSVDVNATKTISINQTMGKQIINPR